MDTACDVSIESDENVVVVDAHDDTEDGTRPPVSTLHTLLLRPTLAQAGLWYKENLFSFVELDTTTPHVLTVVNLQDERFGNTSQITFDSLIVTTGALGESRSASITPCSSPRPSRVHPVRCRRRLSSA